MERKLNSLETVFWDQEYTLIFEFVFNQCSKLNQSTQCNSLRFYIYKHSRCRKCEFLISNHIFSGKNECLCLNLRLEQKRKKYQIIFLISNHIFSEKKK